MSDQEQVIEPTLETVAKRPLAPMPEPQFISMVENLLKMVEQHDKDNVIFTSLMKEGFKDIVGRITWMSDRLVTYEGALSAMTQGLNTMEVSKVLDERREVLYYLFSGDGKDLPNRELIDRVKTSWKRDDLLVVEVDPKERFDPINLMALFTRELRNYATKVEQREEEPEMFSVVNSHDGPKRFVRFDWIEYYLKKHEGKATPQEAIDFAVEQLKVHVFGSIDAVPKGASISVDRDKRDPEVIIEQISTRRI